MLKKMRFLTSSQQRDQSKRSYLGLIAASLLTLGALVACSSEPSEEPVETTVAETQVVDTESAGSNVVEADAVETDNADTVDDVEPDAEPAADENPDVDLDAQVAALPAGAGQSLYESKCHMCHGPGLLNAPKFGDQAAWAERVAKGQDTLRKNSARGFNQMPPQAVDGVSEAQVYAAVDYMVEQSS